MIKASPELDIWETKGNQPQDRPIGGVSFGGYLAYQLQKRNLIQSDLSEVMGWGTSARVSNIVQNKGGVDRELAERMIRLFGLDESERADFLLCGGFLPSQQDIEQIDGVFHPLADRYPTPIFILDFGSRLLTYNEAAGEVFGFSDQNDRIKKQRPSILEMMFDPSWGLQERLAPNWEEVSRSEVETFYMDSFRFGISSYRWYNLLLARLSNFEGFSSLWRDTKGEGREALLRKYPLRDFVRRWTVNLKNTNTETTFAVLHDLELYDSRLQGVTCIPHNSIASQM